MNVQGKGNFLVDYGEDDFEREIDSKQELKDYIHDHAHMFSFGGARDLLRRFNNNGSVYVSGGW
jgi:hypothetical protein